MPTVNELKSDAQRHLHVWIVTGPAGCGKTTVAQYLAERLSLPYVEGDDFHPKPNIDKMASGVPLTDEDRWDWLIILRQQAVAQLGQGASGVIVTCSALKKKYRDVIRVASYDDKSILVHFVYLSADEQLLLQRVKARQGHYMKDSMVHSQFSQLEKPDTTLEKDCLVVDVAGPVPEVQELALKAVKAALEPVVDQVTTKT